MLSLLLHQLPIEVVPFISELEKFAYLYGSRQQLLADAITIQCLTAQPFCQIYDRDVIIVQNSPKTTVEIKAACSFARPLCSSANSGKGREISAKTNDEWRQRMEGKGGRIDGWVRR